MRAARRPARALGRRARFHAPCGRQATSVSNAPSASSASSASEHRPPRGSAVRARIEARQQLAPPGGRRARASTSATSARPGWREREPRELLARVAARAEHGDARDRRRARLGARTHRRSRRAPRRRRRMETFRVRSLTDVLHFEELAVRAARPRDAAQRARRGAVLHDHEHRVVARDRADDAVEAPTGRSRGRRRWRGRAACGRPARFCATVTSLTNARRSSSWRSRSSVSVAGPGSSYIGRPSRRAGLPTPRLRRSRDSVACVTSTPARRERLDQLLLAREALAAQQLREQRQTAGTNQVAPPRE